MKIKYYLLAACGSLLSLAACVEDKGSYDEIPINQVTAEGLQESYSVMAGVTELNIVPTITGTILGNDDSQYQYTWYACDGSDAHNHTVLGNEKELHTVIDLAPANYKLYLIINDTSTGQEWIISNMTLNVNTPLSRGFYVFGDKEDGTVGMDFLSMPYADAPQIDDTADDTIMVRDIFTNQRGLRGAQDLIYTGNNTLSSAVINLWAVTEDGSYKIENSIQESSTFDVDETYDNNVLFHTTYDIQRPVKVLDQYPHQTVGGTAAQVTNRGYVTEEGVYAGAVQGYESFGNPFNRYNLNESESFFRCYKNPFYYANSYSVSLVVLYDMDNNRFVNTVGATGAVSAFSPVMCATIAETSATRFPWDQNQVRRTIVYGENTPYYYSYALMKDMDNDENFYIYGMYVRSRAPQQYYYFDFTTSQATELNQASQYAILGEYPILLYAVGNKLYMFNYDERSTATLLKEFDGEITYLGTEWISSGEGGNIAVCTYNPSAEPDMRGTIYKYNIGQSLTLDPIQIDFNRSEFVYHTPLKVKKLEFRNSQR